MNTAKKAALVVAAAGAALGTAAGSAAADSYAGAEAHKSPGVASGNIGQLPVHVPVNIVGNTATVIGGLNPTFGNTGLND